MPKFKPDDKVQLYALKKPVWQFKFGNTLGKFVSTYINNYNYMSRDHAEINSQKTLSIVL